MPAGPVEQDDIDRAAARIGDAAGADAFAAGAALEPGEILRRAEAVPPEGRSVWADDR